MHLALGRSYPETGATNGSALHWDLVCDLREGGLLSAYGEPLGARTVPSWLNWHGRVVNRRPGGCQ